MRKQGKRLTNTKARTMSEQELCQELRACFIEKTGDADLSPEEEACLRRLVEDIKGNAYTWSQVEGAIVPGWRPGDNILSSGN
jgi:hypothetical protein